MKPENITYKTQEYCLDENGKVIKEGDDFLMNSEGKNLKDSLNE